MAVATGKANGPEDEVLDWDAIDWGAQEDDVRRLRQRIFKATRDGDLKRVRNLQKLMLRSRSNTLVSVRQVTQRNAGRKTAGVDGMVVVTNRGRADRRRLFRHCVQLVLRFHVSSLSGQAHACIRPVERDDR
jgi:RNA-directed DNA polymerase